jgi:hypothetical protein
MEKPATPKNLILAIINNDEGLYRGNLRRYFKIIFLSPSANNPYHNFRHTMYVLCLTYEGGKYAGINKDEMRALLIAALFHDFRHSGHMGNDKQEINRAIEWLRKYILPIDKHIKTDVEDMIRATEWPHRTDIVLTESMKILRDADLSMDLDDVWQQQIIFGLSQEMGISPIHQLRNQLDYLSNQTFQSDWGRKKFASKVPESLAEVKEFLEILDGVKLDAK